MSATLIGAAVRPAPSRAEDWFEGVYRDTAADLYAYVASLLRDRSAAEDVTAQAFERAYRKRRLYSSRRGTPRAWLFAIARNAALDELRRRRRTAALTAEPADAADEPAEERDPERDARRATVRAALATLDGGDRELVLLKFHGQLTNAELARVLRTSESNAGTRLHRAMTRLREACDDAA